VSEIRLPLAAFLEHAADLFRAHPITAVRLTDRGPDFIDDPLSPDGGYGWMYGWQHTLSGAESYPSILPEKLFRLLPDCPVAEVAKERKAGRGIMPRWPTAEAAHAALSAACVSLGRERAGLTPLGE
jgi:hypothetical protein